MICFQSTGRRKVSPGTCSSKFLLFSAASGAACGDSAAAGKLYPFHAAMRDRETGDVESGPTTLWIIRQAPRYLQPSRRPLGCRHSSVAGR